MEWWCHSFWQVETIFRKREVGKTPWQKVSVASPLPLASLTLEIHSYGPLEYVLIPSWIPTPEISAKGWTKYLCSSMRTEQWVLVCSALRMAREEEPEALQMRIDCTVGFPPLRSVLLVLMAFVITSQNDHPFLLSLTLQPAVTVVIWFSDFLHSVSVYGLLQENGPTDKMCVDS